MKLHACSPEAGAAGSNPAGGTNQTPCHTWDSIARQISMDRKKLILTSFCEQ
jgi:hypothetical protein